MESEGLPKDTNPGTMDELHRACQNVYPLSFEGMKVMIHRGLSHHFQVNHNLTLSSNAESGYRFGATYAGTKTFDTPEVYPILLADIDPSGNMNANIVHAFSKKLKTKFTTQIQKSKWISTQLTGDYFAKNYTASLSLGNPDLNKGFGILVAYYLQSVTPKLALGTEFFYQMNPQLPGGHISCLNIMGKYKASETTDIALTLGGVGQVHASFCRTVVEGVKIAAEVETNFRMRESVGSIGYSVAIDKDKKTILKGSVDSEYVVKSVMEKRLDHLPFTVALAGLINHRKNSFQLGCGIIIE